MICPVFATSARWPRRSIVSPSAVMTKSTGARRNSSRNAAPTYAPKRSRRFHSSCAVAMIRASRPVPAATTNGPLPSGVSSPTRPHSATPRSSVRGVPSRIASTADRHPRIPRLAARTLPVPAGTIASGIDRPARMPAAWRTVPSPPTTTTSGGGGQRREERAGGLLRVVDDRRLQPRASRDGRRDEVDQRASLPWVADARRASVDDELRRGSIDVGRRRHGPPIVRPHDANATDRPEEMMDRAGFRAWLQRYIDAWRLNDGTAIGDLFSLDVRYAFDPFSEAIVGRNAVIEAWLDDPDDPGSWEADYDVLAVDGDVFVAHGRTRYLTDDRAGSTASSRTSSCAASTAMAGAASSPSTTCAAGSSRRSRRRSSTRRASPRRHPPRPRAASSARPRGASRVAWCRSPASPRGRQNRPGPGADASS